MDSDLDARPGAVQSNIMDLSLGTNLVGFTIEYMLTAAFTTYDKNVIRF